MAYERPDTHLTKAIFFIILASLFNTLMVFFVKYAAPYLPVQIILFARFFVTLLIILPFVYFNPAQQPIKKFLKTNRLPLHVFRDIFGLISVICYFYSASLISLADATVLFNTAPLFIPIIAYFWGGFKIFHRLWWGMGLGFLGILLILNPGHELLHTGALLGLFSGFCAAIVYVGGRYLTYTEPPLRNMFYYFIIGTFISFLILIISLPNLNYILNIKSIVLLISIGVCGYFYQLFFTHGSKHAPVRLTSSFMYTSVIFSLVLDQLFWNIKPTINSAIGIVFIILGAILLLLLYPKDDTQKSKSPN